MNEKNLNDWAISTEVFEWIKHNIPVGSTILELGSGTGTIELTNYYDVFSIENNRQFIGLAPKSTYLHAPLREYRKGISKYIWYDIPMVKEFIKNIDYDLILVDAPEGKYGREGFIFNAHLFNLGCPIIIDDTNRKPERKIADTLFQQYEFDDYIELNKNPEKGAVVLI